MLFGDNISFQLLDKGNIERFGPFGIAFVSQSAAYRASIFHSGSIAHYLLIITIALISTLFFYSITITNSFTAMTFLLLAVSYFFFCFLFRDSIN